MRLDAFLVERYPSLSRTLIALLIERGQVMVNGTVATKRSCQVGETDVVTLDLPEKPDYSKEVAEFARTRVIYEDERVIVINKPAGMLTHSKGSLDPEFTVADFARAQYNQVEAAAAPNNNRLGIVHRLDRATSGVMIVARDNEASSYLSRQFAERRAHKTYLAITVCMPKETKARLELPLSRDLKSPARFRVNAMGKPAVTEYEVIKSWSDGQALLKLRPLTGRTHQLRVQLAYINAPIVGDPIYGEASVGERLMLHAYKLEITVPSVGGGQRMTFTAPLPKEFYYHDEPR